MRVKELYEEIRLLLYKGLATLVSMVSMQKSREEKSREEKRKAEKRREKEREEKSRAKEREEKSREEQLKSLN